MVGSALLRRLASSAVVLAGVSVITFALARLLPSDPASIFIGPRAGPETIARVREAADILEIVGEQVRLRKRGRTWEGLCPFHDDHHPSFGVNDTENYWNCFAGCGGGSVIDFWMKWQECDFKTAISELAKILL